MNGDHPDLDEPTQGAGAYGEETPKKYQRDAVVVKPILKGSSGRDDTSTKDASDKRAISWVDFHGKDLAVVHEYEPRRVLKGLGRLAFRGMGGSGSSAAQSMHYPLQRLLLTLF